MRRRTILVLVAIAVALAAPAVAFAVLQGAVGPDFTITLKKQNGTVVRHLTPGSHRFHISDMSSAHNFHLFGPGGVDRRTRIAFVGTRNWTVTLVAGTYTYRCDAHPTTMTKTFQVP
jgi:hypothetical protein